ncbi:MAG TPA: hypothetical protein VN947_08610 [Polyangia bacterium]|nr:hypothetical protein [Polyangia bacterium]
MRTTEESCAIIDRISGRCVREPEFAARVMADPAGALIEYDLEPDELEDFVVLQQRHRDEALRGWARVRELLSLR